MDDSILEPRYIQIKKYLIGKIQSGVYKPGDKLPSERELADYFKISRMTARNALVELVRDGYVYRNGPRGTIVAGEKMKHNILTVSGFAEHMKAGGVKNLESRVLTFEKLEADVWLSETLNVSLGTECFHLVRLRIGDIEPIAIDESFINGNFTTDIMQYDFSKESLWRILEQEYHHKPVHGKVTMELYPFNNQECKLLGLKNGSFGLRSRNTNYDSQGNILEYSITYYRGDMFSFSYEVDID